MIGILFVFQICLEDLVLHACFTSDTLPPAEMRQSFEVKCPSNTLDPVSTRASTTSTSCPSSLERILRTSQRILGTSQWIRDFSHWILRSVASKFSSFVSFVTTWLRGKLLHAACLLVPLGDFGTCRILILWRAPPSGKCSHGLSLWDFVGKDGQM